MTGALATTILGWTDEPEEEHMTAITPEPGAKHEPLMVTAVLLITLGTYLALGALALLELPAAPAWAGWTLAVPIAAFVAGWAMVVRCVRVRRR
jgi:hypothetical protein